MYAKQIITNAEAGERSRIAEAEYYRFEEMTDISERLSLPVETAIDFELNDGLLYSSHGDHMASVVAKGYEAAVTEAKMRPENSFQAERSRLELEEFVMAEALGRGELKGNSMAVLSPVPDAVRGGSTSLGGYNREHMRAMVRLYRASDGMVRSTTISLDQSNYKGLQAIAELFGASLPSGLGSEEVLAKRFIFDTTDEEAEWMASWARDAYDRALHEQFGGTWYAGSRFASQQDALSFVKAQPDLVDQHMRAVGEVAALVLNPPEKALKLEQLRQRMAAAVDARVRGKAVVLLSDNAVAEQLAGGDYASDCPVSLGSSGQQLEAMGILTIDSLKCVKCPLPGCGKTVDAVRTHEGGIMCPACNREARGGKIIDLSKTEHVKNGHAVGKQTVGLFMMVSNIIEERRQERFAQRAAEQAAKKAKQRA